LEDKCKLYTDFGQEHVTLREVWVGLICTEVQRVRALEVRERVLIKMPESAGVRKMRIKAPVLAGLITAHGEEVEQGAESLKEVILGKMDTDEKVEGVMAPKKDNSRNGRTTEQKNKLRCLLIGTTVGSFRVIPLIS
jgi:hypothetical protein